MVRVTDLQFYMENRLKEKLDLSIKRMVKQKFDNLFIVDGDEGCLTGDSIINVNRCKLGRKYTIKYMYKQFHSTINREKKWNLEHQTFVRSYDGKSMRLHPIKDVVYSGKKEVYRLKLENGKEIKATADHKIMTSRGWVQLQWLNLTDEVMCDTLLPQRKKQRSYKMKDISLKVTYHPYKNIRNEVEVHRLIYEANLNGLHFKKYLDIVWNDEQIAKELRFINPQQFHVHHKDGNHYNNSAENLELLDKNEHLLLHSKKDEAFRHFNQGIPVFSKVKEIIRVGIEDTYDIKCEEPYHNFVANGMVVHNCGKSTFAIGMAYYVAYKTGRTFPKDCSQVFFDIAKLIEFAKSTEKQIIVWDEAALGGLSSEWRNKYQTELIKLLMVARKKRHFWIFNIPKFFKLNEYLLVDRAIGLVHVYARNETEIGRFCYFKKKSKEKLHYDRIRTRMRNYLKHHDFHGTFPNVLAEIVDERAYDRKKDEAIMSIGNEKEKVNQWKIKYDQLRYTIANTKYKQVELAEELGVTGRTLSSWKKIDVYKLK